MEKRRQMTLVDGPDEGHLAALLCHDLTERNSLPWGFVMSKKDLRNWWTSILKIGSSLEMEQQGKFFAGFSPLQKTSLCAQWNFSVYNCDFFFLNILTVILVPLPGIEPAPPALEGES